MKTTQPNHPLQAECARAANDWDKLLTPKTTHTPGPWYDKPSAGGHQGLVISESTGATVALTYDLADRALVAAAPDLLAALEQMIKAGEAQFGEIGWPAYFHGGLNGGTLRYAREAIAKAKGL